ncbi:MULTISPECIES: hypothetical protein [unclassified Saccharopolyspora]|uniref:hypothetical protein n=1 Tax=Saccharopolyspora TaxID=1835 RepID=UPI001F311FAB|nr:MULTISPECIES: hypothetical protein [unclassified Saccharopolyspora]
MQQHRPEHSSRPGEPKAISRRRLGGLLGAVGAAGALGIAGCSSPAAQRNATQARPTGSAAPDGVLGANFNGDAEIVTFPELQEVEASWLRGFYTMRDADKDDPAKQPQISKLLEAADRGYGTLLSLKFQYHEKEIPQPGTPAMDEELARVDKVLPAAMNRMDILTIGNEPFFETRDQDKNEKLNNFYEAVAEHVISYRDREFGPNCKTRLYMGALNRLDEPEWHTPATERWMTFVRETPAIEGVDIHPHVAKPENVQKYLDYVLPKLRPDQKFLATEFSLVLFWEDQMEQPVSGKFAKQYGFPADTKVWQVVDAAIDKRFPQQQWNDFLSMSPWYENHKHFLRNQVQRFRDTGKLALATYGIAQDDAMVTNWDKNSKPWLFNSLFASKTVQPGPDGLPGRSYGWIEDFRALQRESDRRPTR